MPRITPPLQLQTVTQCVSILHIYICIFRLAVIKSLLAHLLLSCWHVQTAFTGRCDLNVRWYESFKLVVLICLLVASCGVWTELRNLWLGVMHVHWKWMSRAHRVTLPHYSQINRFLHHPLDVLRLRHVQATFRLHKSWKIVKLFPPSRPALHCSRSYRVLCRMHHLWHSKWIKNIKCETLYALYTFLLK